MLDVHSQLSLRVTILDGFVKISGSASYFDDQKSDIHEFFVRKMPFCEKRILFAEDGILCTRGVARNMGSITTLRTSLTLVLETEPNASELLKSCYMNFMSQQRRSTRSPSLTCILGCPWPR